MSQRLSWIDVSRGIGIILVVLAHVLLASNTNGAIQIARYVYQFHMPLFFILAGMTLRLEPLIAFSMRKAMTLLLAYMMFVIVLGLPALIVSCGYATNVPALGIDRCGIMVVKLILGGSTLGGMFGTFWFVSCLFLALLLAQVVLKILSGSRTSKRLSVLGLLIVVAYGLPILVPASTFFLAFGVVPMATVLVLVGYWLARHDVAWTKNALALAIATAALSLAFNSPFDMKYGIYGIPLLGIVGAIALSCLFMRLAQAVAPFPIVWPLTFLGQNTLAILFLHQLVHLGARLAGVSNEALLVTLSLSLPLLFHRPVIVAVAAINAAVHSHLSPKSPSA